MLDVDLQGEMAFPVADEPVRRGVPFLFAKGHGADIIPARFAHVTRCEKPVDRSRIVSLLLARGSHEARSGFAPPCHAG